MIVRLILAPDEAIADAAAHTQKLAGNLGVPHDFVEVEQTFNDEHYVQQLSRLSPAAAQQWSDRR